MRTNDFFHNRNVMINPCNRYYWTHINEQNSTDIKICVLILI